MTDLLMSRLAYISPRNKVSNVVINLHQPRTAKLLTVGQHPSLERRHETKYMRMQ